MEIFCIVGDMDSFNELFFIGDCIVYEFSPCSGTSLFDCLVLLFSFKSISIETGSFGFFS